MTIPEALAALAAREPLREAYVSQGRRITYGELWALSQRAAAGLQAAGIGRGDRVALTGPNTWHFVVAYHAIVRLGASVVPINPLFKPDEVRFVLGNSGARLLVLADPLLPVARAACEGLDCPPTLVTYGRSETELSLEGWLTTELPLEAVDVRPEDIAAILYTSGTTGRPKGAMLSHANLTWDARSSVDAYEFASEDVLLIVLPLFHSYAATVGLIVPLIVGCKVVLLERFLVTSLFELCDSEAVTVLPLVPAMCAALLRDAHLAAPGSFRAMRMFVSGGAPLPVQLIEPFERTFGGILIEGDGPTECSPVVSANPVHGVRKPGTVGVPIPGVEMRIVDDDDRELPEGEVGEICVRGPNVMVGYWNDPEATAEAIRDGWFHTGDLGTRDADGYFSIVDRKKDMIIVGGMNVYPSEVERVLRDHPAVFDAAVVGGADEIRGERVRAFVMLRPGATATTAELARHCRGLLANFKVPKEILLVEDLPRTLTGKVLKRELRDPHWHGV